MLVYVGEHDPAISAEPALRSEAPRPRRLPAGPAHARFIRETVDPGSELGAGRAPDG